jgi:membrane-bound lytic murein transglycosylase D
MLTSHMKIRLPFILLFLTLFPAAYSQQPIAPPDTAKAPAFVNDDPVVSMLDSLSMLTIFQQAAFLKPPAPKTYQENYIPYFPDSVNRERIAGMNEQSPFEYVYNDQVRQFIDLYAYKKRELTERILGLSQIYFPLFEEQLDKYNLPLELKYLAVIESALNPIANSRAGAKGLWQFMYSTGKVYGLHVTSYVDDRFDPYKSTIAACEHLKDLYDIYGNWSLALAAYNSGAGNVNKAIRRAGGLKNFWLIYPYLPRETRSYVPAFIAASYVLTFSDQFNLSPVDPGILFYEIDTVTVRNVLTFDQISEMLQIPMDELVFLNPWFKQHIIPATPDHPYPLRLKRDEVGNFINNETALYAYKTRKNLEKDSLLALVENSYRSTQVYVVRSGDNLSSIARKYHMTTAELKALNNLSKNYVRSRQRLLVYSPTSHTAYNSGPGPSQQTSDNTSGNASPETSANVSHTPVATKYHVVKSGENLSLISRKYGCSVQQLMAWNGLKSQKILVGQKLKVSGGTSSKSIARNESSGSTSGSKSSSQKYIVYTIQSGDNLWDLANKYDVTVAQIKQMNSITNSSKLRPGQKIRIPNSK